MPTFALISWPVLGLGLFAVLARLPGLIVCVLLPYLFLPEAFELPLPGLPNLDKRLVIALTLGLIFLLMRDKLAAEPGAQQTRIANRLFYALVAICVALMFLSPLVTSLTNPEPLIYGPLYMPPMRMWDVISMTADTIVALTPFLIAQRYLATPESHQMLMRSIVFAALGYSVLMLVEARFSPQLHNWVYGFHQHSFIQHVRDGFRPKVFLEHGIHVGFFVFISLLAAVSLWKAEGNLKWALAAGFLAMMLVISRNLGALMIVILALGLWFGMPQRPRIIAMIVIGAMVLTYPMLRQSGLLPIDSFLSFVESISEDRAQSLEFRLNNEEKLLEHALKKPLGGWGLWGRNRIYDDQGHDISVTDGLWIQMLGAFGWLYYLGLFGLLSVPLFFLPGMARRKGVAPETMGLALILTGNLIYQIPNTTLTPLNWLIVGALTGAILRDLKQTAAYEAEEDDKPAGGVSYSRFTPVSGRNRKEGAGLSAVRTRGRSYSETR